MDPKEKENINEEELMSEATQDEAAENEEIQEEDVQDSAAPTEEEKLAPGTGRSKQSDRRAER